MGQMQMRRVGWVSAWIACALLGCADDEASGDGLVPRLDIRRRSLSDYPTTAASSLRTKVAEVIAAGDHVAIVFDH